MDFSLTQEQQDLRELTAKIFEDLAPLEGLPDMDAGQDWFNEKLWANLASAGLLGIALPESVGGLGLGIAELAVLLEANGRHGGAAPLYSTLILGALPIAEFGSSEQAGSLLPDVIAGKALLSAALVDEASDDPLAPGVSAESVEGGWKLRGTKTYVPAAAGAALVLVSARTEDNRLAVFMVEPGARGVSLEPVTTTTGEFQYWMTLDDVQVGDNAVLGAVGQGREIVEWILDRALTGLCAMELGCAERALQLTARYTSDRKQFDKPIATFQAVAQRAADAYIDVEAIRLATWQAVWRLDAGLPASREIAIAKFWAAEAGHRACYAAQHLHGGIGVDTDYPLHHLYLLSRQIELTFGGAHAQLARIGDMIAAD
jgi:alkylation response protein AidB-like acyl-CoA dehydrogenase